MSPLDIIYSWQAILCAVACVGVTEAIKTTIDVRIGAAARKRSAILSRLVLPMLPIWVGALYAVAIPMHPEALGAYLEAQGVDGWPRIVSLAAWGGACGQFSTWIYDRAERLIKANGGQR